MQRSGRRGCCRQAAVHPLGFAEGYGSAERRAGASGGARSCRTSLASERETSELREQFIAVVGHDLRNPLASVSARARILGREAQTDVIRPAILALTHF
ncbi:hypothetical protein LRP30_03235 [Bradyrhizobium sp. C-145]|uniref:histidine kinase dimerization/phospho-acceptor domain-containing protein n=1 Tax=Bradyrhizobium sp. C-145 TaxID=574727 RepID=UPI00201B8D95|nr:histidine kinase dimerization/phospho-acceptor domain-containing protein [Bradyrhizobium sp. C-145]UQR64344.1 hypothetical protein LRP30_03235 [Bradyrhizobium sp. C-145]